MQTIHKKRSRKLNFSDGFEKLAAFVKKNHRLPSRADDPRLFNWQRAIKLRYRLNMLKAQEIMQLESLGFSFNEKEEQWLKRATKIRQLLQDCKTLPPFRHRSLHHWLSRYCYLLLLDQLPAEKKRMVQEIRERLMELIAAEQKNNA